MQNPDFPRAEYQARCSRIQKTMDSSGMDGFIITQQENIGYFSGYRKPMLSKRRGIYLFVPRQGHPVLVLPFGEKGNCEEMSWLYPDQVKYWAGHSGAPDHPELSPDPIRLLHDVSIGSSTRGQKIGIESDLLVNTMRLEMTLADFNALRDIAPHLEFVDAAELIWNQRMVKSPLELQYVKTSCRITCRGYDKALSIAREGVTERDLAKKFYETVIAEDGQDDPLLAFLHIHSGKERSHVRNARPTDRKLKKGDFLSLDGGACYRGYYTDIIRMGHIGALSIREQELFDAALHAQELSLRAIKDGRNMNGVYNGAFTAFKQAGFDESKMVLSSIGHGVGLDVHEPPLVTRGNEQKLRTGMVLSIEPAISESGTGYVVENQVAVTDTGFENFTPLREGIWIG